jgi:YD repeat-containing protein
VHGGGTSDSFNYTVPSGGTNKVLVVLLSGGAASASAHTITVSQNGVSVPMNELDGGSVNQAYMAYGVLAAPTSGTFSASWTGGFDHYTFTVFTVQNAALTGTVDSSAFHKFNAATTDSLTDTTNTGNTLLLDISHWGNISNALTNSGSGESDVLSSTNSAGAGGSPPALIEGQKVAGSFAGTETMTTSATISDTGEHGMIAIKSPSVNVGIGTTTTYAYTYGGTGYANPDAVTAIATITSVAGTGGISTATPALDATSSSITNGFNGTITKTWTHNVTGSNAVLVLTDDIWQDVGGTGTITSASWNGAAFTKATSTQSVGMESEIWYLVATTTGPKTMSVTVTGNTDAIKLAASSFTGVSTFSPLESSKAVAGISGNPSINLTSVTASDLVAATLSRFSTTDATTSVTSLYKDKTSSTLGAASYQIASGAGTYTDTYTGSVAQDWSMAMIALRAATSTTSGGTSTSIATTTYAYDNNGNLTSVGTGIATTTYTYDYANRLIALSAGGATTTYGYDAFGSRVLQTGTTTTYIYPSKYYSVTSSATASSTTEYVFNGDTLLATADNTGTSTSSGGGGTVSTSTPAYVQSKKDSVNGIATFTNPVSTGNLVVVGLTIWNTTVPSNAISDNKGNTYTKIAEAINASSLDHVAIFVSVMVAPPAISAADPG